MSPWLQQALRDVNFLAWAFAICGGIILIGFISALWLADIIGTWRDKVKAKKNPPPWRR